jgi:hypothetical protein
MRVQDRKRNGRRKPLKRTGNTIDSLWEELGILQDVRARADQSAKNHPRKPAREIVYRRVT